MRIQPKNQADRTCHLDIHNQLMIDRISLGSERFGEACAQVAIKQNAIITQVAVVAKEAISGGKLTLNFVSGDSERALIKSSELSLEKAGKIDLTEIPIEIQDRDAGFFIEISTAGIDSSAKNGVAQFFVTVLK